MIDRLLKMLIPAAIMISLWMGLWWACKLMK